jgi:hypothetical protein
MVLTHCGCHHQTIAGSKVEGMGKSILLKSLGGYFSWQKLIKGGVATRFSLLSNPLQG